MFGNLKKAQNPATDFVTLRRLALSKNTAIRKAIAANRNTQAHVIDALATDSNPKVRAALLDNPNLTKAAWEILAEDKNSAVVEALKAKRPESPAAKSHRL